MNKKFFDFCHMLYRHDKDISELDSDVALTICSSAYQACKETFITPDQWIGNHYKSWVLSWDFITQLKKNIKKK